jgi:hypothetical protein
MELVSWKDTNLIQLGGIEGRSAEKNKTKSGACKNFCDIGIILVVLMRRFGIVGATGDSARQGGPDEG